MKFNTVARHGGLVALTVLLMVASAAAALDWNRVYQDIPDTWIQNVPYIEHFKAASERTGVPLLLLISVARGESNFNPKAVSNKDALGIMQILWPGTAHDLGFTKREQLFDPEANINAGADYLAQLLKRYNNNIHYAVAAYFSGPARIGPGKKTPWYGEEYADYIYSKLSAILKTPYTRKVYASPNVKKVKPQANPFYFDSFEAAERFVGYVKKKDAGIPLEIEKGRMNTFIINIAAAKSSQIDGYKKRLKKVTGLEF